MLGEPGVMRKELPAMWGELHESKTVQIMLDKIMNAGKANRIFRELGAKLFYDVYDFEANEHENWQSESLLGITLKLNGIEVDAQDDFDEIEASYLFASRPSSDQNKALDLIQILIKKFNGKGIYQGADFNMAEVQMDWDKCTDFLLKEWGEEPGSKSLSIMIEENYA
jgi:hypothetical protein